MNLEIVSKSDYIICLGSMISKDNEQIKELIIKAIAKNSAEFIYMHPIDDIDIKLYSTQFVKYEVGSEEGILALFLEYFTKNRSDKLENFINELDIGYISAESSVGEEEFEEMINRASNKKTKTLILGEDLFTHERVENIKSMIKVLEEFSDLNIILVKDLELESKSLEEPEELDSYNGTVIYTYKNSDENQFVYGSESFSRVAKISNKEKVKINYKNESVEKVFKLDKNLQGTIALCGVKSSDNSFLSNGYRYKQVKIEKVDA